MKKPRGVLIAGNWKMNLLKRETESFFSELSSKLSNQLPALKPEFASQTLQAALFPATFSLEIAKTCAAKLPLPISIGAQNVHWAKSGAFTGEISGPMLLELGLKLSLVGHSERRQYFGETDETALKRTQSLLEQEIRVILCVGETRAEREGGKTKAVLTQQLNAVLGVSGSAVSAYLDGRLIIAYEPVWAIGTGLTASPEQAEEAHQLIRKLIWDGFGMQAAGKTMLLYGGSVTPENIDSLLACPNVDGALVGGASLKPEGFAALLLASHRAIH